MGGDGRPQGEGGDGLYQRVRVTQPFKEVSKWILLFFSMIVAVNILLKVLVDVAVFR